MKQIRLMIIRNFKLSFDGIWKSLLMVGLFGVGMVSLTLAPIAKSFDSQNISNSTFLNLGITFKILAISGLVFWIAKRMQNDLKRGIIKNFFANNFTKQHYFLGIVLYWTIVIIVSSTISLILWLVASNTDGLRLKEPAYIKTLFICFYFFIIPIFTLWFFSIVLWFSFKLGKVFTIQVTIIAILNAFLILWFFFIYPISNNQWITYILMILPPYNLLFAIPQKIELFRVCYWWVYIIDLFYIVVVLVLVFFWKKDHWLKINGKFSNKFF